MNKIVPLLLLLSLSSCSMHKLMNRKPTEAAQECALRFPCIDSLITADTQFITQVDTLWELSFPDTVVVNCPPAEKASAVKVVCPPVKTYTITKRINTTKTYTYKVTDKAKEAVLITAQADLAHEKESKGWWKTACLITWGVIALFLGYKVVKLIKP